MLLGVVATLAVLLSNMVDNLAYDTIFGLKVLTQDSELTRVPKLSFKRGIASETVTEEFNAWLAERFGFTYQCYRIGMNTLVIHPDILTNLKTLGTVTPPKIGGIVHDSLIMDELESQPYFSFNEVPLNGSV